MKHLKFKTLGLFIALFTMITLPDRGHSQTIIEFSGGAGYSLMEDGWYDGPGKVWDDNHIMWQVYTQVYPYMIGKVTFGVEIGFQRYLWYEIRERDIWSNTWKKYDEDTEGDWRLLALFRGYIAGGFFGELGIGLYDFENFGLEGSLGYDIKLSKVVYIPIKIRCDFTLDEYYGNILAPGMTLGVAYRIGGD